MYKMLPNIGGGRARTGHRFGMPQPERFNIVSAAKLLQFKIQPQPPP